MILLNISSFDLVEQDTFSRDNIVNHNGVSYDAKRRYKLCPKEFKDEPMVLITEQGYTVAKVAEGCGVATHMPTETLPT